MRSEGKEEERRNGIVYEGVEEEYRMGRGEKEGNRS